MRVAVIADTHTRGPSRPIPEGAWPFLESADHILHAGDVVDPAVLDEMNALAPVTVVLGNSDSWDVAEWGATETAELTLGGLRAAIVHDSGPAKGRRDRMRARFPDARVVVFGHSHQPACEDSNGLLLFNPGSATWKRRAPYTSMGMLHIDRGEVEGEIIPV